MTWIQKMELKYGKYAIPNLMLWAVICYALGFILMYAAPNVYWDYMSLNMEAIFRGQVWRIFTYVIYPPSTDILWCVFLCYIYYRIGRGLEMMWGSFYFNLYVFIGLIALVLAALIVYLLPEHYVFQLSTQSLFTSMILAYAFTLPESRFYIMMILPIKGKYLGAIYAVILLVEVLMGDWPVRVMVIASVANFLVFYFFIFRHRSTMKQMAERVKFTIKADKARVRQENFHHRCAVCGRTDVDSPDLEFRYCSKCSGGREYCIEHLYTHMHVIDNDQMQGPEE